MTKSELPISEMITVKSRYVSDCQEKFAEAKFQIWRWLDESIVACISKVGLTIPIRYRSDRRYPYEKCLILLYEFILYLR